MYDVLKRLKDRGVTFGINTNLTLLDPEIVVLLKNLGIKSVLTSLMSADQEINDALVQRRGSFKRTIAGIKLAISMGLGVTINMVVTRRNFATIQETGRLAKELGASTFCATKASAPPNCLDFSEFAIDGQQLSEMFITLLLIRKMYGIRTDSLEHYPACVFPNEEARAAFGSRNCSAGKTSCTIGFDGNIRPCSHAPMSCGNIKDGMRQSWLKMSCWRTDELVPIHCKEICGESPKKCGGGCRVEAYRDCHRLDGLDPFCICSKPIPKPMVIVHPIEPATVLRVSKQVRFRSESFGVIAFYDQRNWLVIDNKLHEFLLGLRKESGVVSISKIALLYEVSDDEAQPTFQKLVAKRILTKDRKGGDKSGRHS